MIKCAQVIGKIKDNKLQGLIIPKRYSSASFSFLVESAKSVGDDNCNLYDAPVNTSDQLKKSGINKGNAINYLAFIFRIFHVCAEKQSAVKPHDAIGKKEDPALIVVSLRNTLPSLSLPCWLQKTPKYLFIFVADTRLFLCILFLKLEIYILFSWLFNHLECSRTFWNVLGCSMFQVLLTAIFHASVLLLTMTLS